MQGSRGARWLAGYYFLYFAGVGITLPFLPAYFVSLGMSATQSGVLLALSPMLGLVAPPLFGRWSDRAARRDRVLLWASLGACVAWAPLIQVRAFLGCALVMAAYAFFNSAIVPLVDTLTLDHLTREQGDYAHVRLFGSVGFIVASAAFGLAVEDVNRAIVFVPLGLLALGAVVALRLPASAPVGHRAATEARWRPEREVWLLLAACALHWIASAPYNGTFVLHVKALGLPNRVVGVSAALGVLAEVVAMAVYPRLSVRAQPRTLLALSFAASALRWLGMVFAVHGVAIAALTLLHGLTFGLFYVAAVDAVSRRVPSERRARGLALFVAVTFGVGGLVGYLLAGKGFDVLGGARLFGVAAVVELVALLPLLGLHPAKLNVAVGGPSEPS